MDHDKEIRSLAAQAMAFETVLGCVLGRLAGPVVSTRSAIAQGFADAHKHIESRPLPDAPSSWQLDKALEIVEQLRTAALGRPEG